GAEFKFGEILDTSKGALGAVNLLVVQPAQADRVEPEAPLLRPLVGAEMELAGGMAIDVAVQTCDAQRCVSRFAVIGRIEFFLWEGSQKYSEAVELDRREDVFEKPIVIIDRDHFSARDIAKLRTILQEDCRREFGQECFWNVEVHIKSLQARKHRNLNLWENLAAGRL